MCRRHYHKSDARALADDDLLPELLAKLADRSSAVVRAATGAGETTRVPPALLDARLAQGRILVIEPRRLAARAAARRMAFERGQKLGEEVGYHVRFDRQAGPNTRAHPRHDPRHPPAHAARRSVSRIDRRNRLRRIPRTRPRQRSRPRHRPPSAIHRAHPELRLVVMSATLATEAVAAYLGDCGIVTSEGRLHPVEIAYEPRSLRDSWPAAAARAIERMLPRTPGDVLCFLPGMQEIRQTMRELDDVARAENLLVLPLHGDLSAAEQDRACCRRTTGALCWRRTWRKLR